MPYSKAELNLGRLCFPYTVELQEDGNYVILNRHYKPIGFNLGPQLLRHLAQLRVLLKVPADPDHHQQDPEHLDGQKNGDRMVEPLCFQPEAFDHGFEPDRRF